jgi:hypothetical protein
MTDTTKELLDDAKETIKSIGNTSRERLSSPLLGPFIIALLLYNWRPVTVLLFSYRTIDCKIAVIDEKYCGLDGLFWPIAIAFVYYLAIPVVMAGCETILLPIEKARIWIRYNKLGKEAEEEKDYQAVRSGNKEVEALNNEIKNLKTEMALMIDTHDTTVSRYIKQVEELNKSNRKNGKNLLSLVKKTTRNYEKYNPILAPKTNDFIIQLHESLNNFNGKELPSKIYQFLSENDFIENTKESFIINGAGKEFYNYLNTNYIITQSNLFKE